MPKKKQKQQKIKENQKRKKAYAAGTQIRPEEMIARAMAKSRVERTEEIKKIVNWTRKHELYKSHGYKGSLPALRKWLRIPEGKRKQIWQMIKTAKNDQISAEMPAILAMANYVGTDPRTIIQLAKIG